MELALRGVIAAPGAAIGRARVLDWVAPTAHRTIAGPARSAEGERARAALRAAAADLEAIASRLQDTGRRDEAEIIEAGVLMARDPGLVARVESLVLESGFPAAAALRTATEESASQLAGLPDPMLALRADDVRSLGRRAADRASGVRLGSAGGVLVTSTLGPADVAELGASGIALVGGGVAAHAAIVARSLGIPMVVGLGREILDVEDGEEVVIDGDAGVFVRHPDRARIKAARINAAARTSAREEAREHRLLPAMTRDGRGVTVLGNAATTAEVIEASEQGAEGAGLLRTELGFLDARAWPSVGQHKAFLSPILGRLEGRTATVRLLDFGGDKTPPFLRGATGRGVELLLESREALTAQLAAIVDAGGETKLRILIPMVTSPDQVQAVRKVLSIVLDGRPAPEVGSMIETSEAARRAAEIANASDFLSLGTNDLTQFVLGLDREHSKAAPVTDVRVLRLIDATVRAAHAAGIPVDVCGEAASDVEAMPVMVGLGIDELSVAAARVGEVRKWIRGLDFEACREAAERRLLGEAADAGRKGR